MAVLNTEDSTQKILLKQEVEETIAPSSGSFVNLYILLLILLVIVQD